MNRFISGLFLLLVGLYLYTNAPDVAVVIRFCPPVPTSLLMAGAHPCLTPEQSLLQKFSGSGSPGCPHLPDLAEHQSAVSSDDGEGAAPLARVLW